MYRRLYELLPDFFRKWDHHLLIHHPHIWATLGHYVLGLLVLGYVSVIGIDLSLGIDFANVPSPQTHINAGILIVSVLVLIWIVVAKTHRMSRVPVSISLTSRLAVQGIFIGGVILLASLPLLHGFLLHQRIQHSISPVETYRRKRGHQTGRGFL